jgi:hypothetical protein
MLKSEKGILFFILFFFVFLIFREQIIHPYNLLLAGGDGTKNYFTFLYHIKHDPAFWKFEGMHYPFGENIVFTDNQPLLANLLKWLYGFYPMTNETLIAIHNLVLIFSLIVGGFGIFLVLRKLGTGFLFAVACTMGLILLQPQINRFNSHYSMVYPVLPWIYYLWLRIWENPVRWGPSIAISGLAAAFGMIHMYHYLTIAVLCTLATGLTFLAQPECNRAKKLIMQWSVQVVVPFLILYIVSNTLYPNADRPSKVWGFFSYHSSWEGLFFSYELPLFRWINEHIYKVRSLDFVEGVNYIGLVSVIFIIVSIFTGLFQWRNLSYRLKNSFGTKGKLTWIFVLSACISFGYPFTIKGLEGLLDYTGPFQQFRSIGRIGWVSFYAINFVALPYIYQQTLILKNRIWQWSIWILVPAVIVWEGYKGMPQMTNPPHLTQAFQTLQEPLPFDISEFQALLSDPYLHVGSECFSWPHVGLNQDQAFEVGMQTGLPNMITVLSRTSLSQSALLNQLVCQPYQVPDIIDSIKKMDSRPLLVLESNLELYNRNSSLSHWTKGTSVVYKTDEYTLRALPLSHFETVVRQFLDSIGQIQTDTVFVKNLDFKELKKEKNWGFESIVYLDSTMRGDALFSFEIEFHENTDVNSITEIWQITKEHQNAGQFSVRNNYHYKRIAGNKLFIEIPIHIQNETDKIAIRLSKDRQKKGDKKFFNNPLLIQTAQRPSTKSL